MQPTFSAGNSHTASISLTQVEAKDNANTGLGIANVESSLEQMETSFVRLSFVHEVLYSSSAFVLPHVKCLPIVIPDGEGGQVVENCSVDQQGHTHAAQIFREVAADDNPIPSGASWRQDTLRYLNESELGCPMPKDRVAVETAIESFFENDDPLNQLGGRLETIRDLSLLPIEQGQPPMLMLGFRRHISYAPQDVDTASVESLPDTAKPRYKALFKIQEILSGQLSVPEWGVPHHWDKLPSATQEVYLKDIIELYDAGATLQALGRRHGIHANAVRALLYLQIGNRLRTTRNELLQSIANKRNNGFPVGIVLRPIAPLKEQLQLARVVQAEERAAVAESE